MKKMKYEKMIVAMAVLTFVFSAGLSSVQAMVAKGMAEELLRDVERAELILESIEYGSYESWRKLVNNNSKIAKKVCEEDFNEFVRARKLARQGKYEEALNLCDDLKAKLSLDDRDVSNIVSSLGIGDEEWQGARG
jgi:hypothetical protein